MNVKASRSRCYWLGKKFSDNKKFPYGFSRSGVFSLNQSEVLESKGCLMQALLNGVVENPSREDLEFIEAVNKGIFTHNLDTLVWYKYVTYAREIHTLAERPKRGQANAHIESVDFEILNPEKADWTFEDAANSDYLEAG